MLHEGLALSRELGYKQGVAAALLGLGNCMVSEGSDENAHIYYEESARLFKEVGDKNQLAFAVRRLGLMALRQTDYPRAFASCAESLSLNMETRDGRGVAASLTAIASIAAQRGRPEPAARLYGATSAVLESQGAQLIPMDQTENEPYLLSARAEMGNDAFDKAFSEGRAMNMGEAVAYAHEQAHE